MEPSGTQSGLGTAVVVLALALRCMAMNRVAPRCALRKGALEVQAGKPYDALLESVSARDDVTVDPGPVGDSRPSGCIRPRVDRTEALLHFLGGSFQAGSVGPIATLSGTSGAGACGYGGHRGGNLALVLPRASTPRGR